MEIASWSAVAGLLLILMALGDSLLSRLPLSTSMLYLAVGVAISPVWLDWTHVALATHGKALERLAEIVVLLSLFGSGLKMSLGLGDGRWLLPLRLAVVSMLITVALIAVAGVAWLGLPLGAAILLGGILAPTDPVLASDVQVAEPGDRDRLRFSLTGEAGLNDGTAFPVVLLGLGLLGLHDLGGSLWRWLAVDVAWAMGAGIGIGALLGTLVGRLVLYLRRTHKEAVGLDNFLALGLIGLSYGAAVLAAGNGFLSVFAAGVALRRLEQRSSAGAKVDALPSAPAPLKTRTAQRRKRSAEIAAEAQADPDLSHAEQVATDPKHAPAFMAHAVLSFNEQIERIGEVAAVIAIGMLLWAVDWDSAQWVFVAALLLVIRPVSVALGLAGSKTSRSQRVLTGWFGIRGIGSLFYLAYAMTHGLAPDRAAELIALVLPVVVVSIVVHGISVTPLMALYERRKKRSATVTGVKRATAPELAASQGVEATASRCFVFMIPPANSPRPCAALPWLCGAPHRTWRPSHRALSDLFTAAFFEHAQPDRGGVPRVYLVQRRFDPFSRSLRIRLGDVHRVGSTLGGVPFGHVDLAFEILGIKQNLALSRPDSIDRDPHRDHTNPGINPCILPAVRAYLLDHSRVGDRQRLLGGGLTAEPRQEHATKEHRAIPTKDLAQRHPVTRLGALDLTPLSFENGRSLECDRLRHPSDLYTNPPVRSSFVAPDDRIARDRRPE